MTHLTQIWVLCQAETRIAGVWLLSKLSKYTKQQLHTFINNNFLKYDGSKIISNMTSNYLGKSEPEIIMLLLQIKTESIWCYDLFKTIKSAKKIWLKWKIYESVSYSFICLWMIMFIFWICSVLPKRQTTDSCLSLIISTMYVHGN